MMNEPNPNMHFYHIKNVSWSAIFAGAFVAIGLAFLLNVFSVAIGLSAFTMSPDGATTVAIGGFAALLIGGIASMYTAGWVAGFLGRACCKKHNWGVLYGFLAWCVALVLTALIASHIGDYVNSYGQFVSNPASVETTNNPNMPAVSTTNREETTQRGSEPKVVVNMMKATNGMAMGAFIIFILFLIGALSSAFGGFYGMERRKKCMLDDTTCC